MNRPRLAIIGLRDYPSRGGTSRVVEDLVEELKDTWDITLYCERSKDPGQHAEGLTLVRIPRMPFGSLGVFLFYAICSIHLLWRGQQDLVHVHKVDACALLPLLAWRFPTIATSHESPYTRDKWSWLARSYFRLTESLMLRYATAVTCVSEKLSTEYQARTQRPVHFIANGIRAGFPVDQEAAAQQLRALRIDGPFLLFAARRIMASKGCHTLLDALQEQRVDLPLIIVGDFDQLPAYTRRLQSLAEGLPVAFVPALPRSTLMGLVEQAEAFVFPSETEGMSMMLLEVAWLGTPIFASDIPENTNVFSDQEISYFPTGDSAALSTRLEQHIEQPEAAAERALRARQRVQEFHEIQQVVERYDSLYRRVLDQERARSDISGI